MEKGFSVPFIIFKGLCDPQNIAFSGKEREKKSSSPGPYSL
jgi:hypothetical protein